MSNYINIFDTVITSYSIHYTKLYDHDADVGGVPSGGVRQGEAQQQLRRDVALREDETPAAEDLHADHRHAARPSLGRRNNFV